MWGIHRKTSVETRVATTSNSSFADLLKDLSETAIEEARIKADLYREETKQFLIDLSIAKSSEMLECAKKGSYSYYYTVNEDELTPDMVRRFRDCASFCGGYYHYPYEDDSFVYKGLKIKACINNKRKEYAHGGFTIYTVYGISFTWS